MIPQSYSSHIAPVSSAKLHHEVDTSKDPEKVCFVCVRTRAPVCMLWLSVAYVHDYVCIVCVLVVGCGKLMFAYVHTMCLCTCVYICVFLCLRAVCLCL